MKSQGNTYKSFPFPLRIFLSYVILSAAGMVLLDMLSMYLIVTDSLNGFLNTILCIGLLLVAFLVGMFILIMILCAFCGSKIYRGNGLYRFTTAVSILCPVAFVGIIIFMKATNMTYTFFNFITLLFEFAVPPILMLALRGFTRRCDRCGLINTYKVSAVKTKNLGTEHKFHTEGGYYIDTKTTGTIERPWYDGGNMNAELRTQQYVPKTTVYDGLFEKKSTTTDYRCAVCGNVIKETATTETKIGG